MNAAACLPNINMRNRNAGTAKLSRQSILPKSMNASEELRQVQLLSHWI
jgi:hypothetical protein